MPEPTQGGVPDGAFDAAVERLIPTRPRLSRDARRNEETRISVALEAAAPFFREQARKHFEEDLLSNEAVTACSNAIESAVHNPDRDEEYGPVRAGLEAALSVSREGGRS